MIFSPQIVFISVQSCFCSLFCSTTNIFRFFISIAFWFVPIDGSNVFVISFFLLSMTTEQIISILWIVWIYAFLVRFSESAFRVLNNNFPTKSVCVLHLNGKVPNKISVFFSKTNFDSSTKSTALNRQWM